MMMRDAPPAPRAALTTVNSNVKDTENVPQAKQLLSTQPQQQSHKHQQTNTTTKPTNKWLANATRIVLAPVDCNTSTATLKESPQQSPKQHQTIPTVAAITPITLEAPISVAPAPAKLTLSELTDREFFTKEKMTAAGKICMDAWNAALEASRAYRAVRKEWRRAKFKLEKRVAKIAPAAGGATAVPVVALQDQPQPLETNDATESNEESVVEAADQEQPLTRALAAEDLGEQIDEVEEMEEAVHAVEQSEVQYAALTHQEEQMEAAELEFGESQQQTDLAASTSSPTNGPHPNFGVLSFSFGGKFNPSRSFNKSQSLSASAQARPSASDKARALALKLKLEQDMREHEARRLALQEQQRVKTLEAEKRRLAAKEKVDEALAKKTHGKSADEAEKKRLQAESRKKKIHEEEKRHKQQAKVSKRKELEQTISEMKAAEKKHSKHPQQTGEGQ